MHKQNRQTILSGMRPTGSLHIGNYLGALKNWVDLQNSGNYKCFFMIADLHAMSEKFEAKKLPNRIKNLILDYLACGLDPNKSIILIQSHILEHTYLSWIFATLTPIAELQRMHQFKEKKDQYDQINAGLFTYPILMAADILIYKSDTVPVGEDQTQHVEITRDIARKFNNCFGNTFPEPKVLLTPTPRVMSLTEPTAKMSKSKGEKNYIALSDDEITVRKKIMSAVTDIGANGEMSPGVANLFALLDIFASDRKICDAFKAAYDSQNLKYQELKEALAQEITKILKPVQEKRAELEQKPDQIGEILFEGTKKARAIAQATLEEVREKAGLLAK
ncbi:MAG: tryptophan--tRNA ligase [Candidatus Jacksonbacteria bacterium]